LCAEFGQTLNMKVIDLLNTFPESIYSLIFVEYAESYDFCKSVVSNYQFQISVNTFSFGQQFNMS
jgi:hypothetical protein